MSACPRVVLDTNVVVSAFLWEGKPGRLLALAGEGDIRLFTSRALLTEIRATLHKPKLAKAVAATDTTVDTILTDYRRLVTVVRATSLATAISRDPDDDWVIACAITARADVIVSGDDDLLVLKTVAGIAIRPVADLLRELETT
jgi:putative PIN family toxin of toxin-antitoxin system